MFLVLNLAELGVCKFGFAKFFLPYTPETP